MVRQPGARGITVTASLGAGPCAAARHIGAGAAVYFRAAFRLGDQLGGGGG